MENAVSKAYFHMAKEYMPGGVNSPVRACKSVGCDPPFVREAHGCYIYDEEGREYIDYVCSWGPMILGHGHPHVKAMVEEALQLGTSFGAPTWREVELAKRITELVPSIDMVRLVNSGTEATMSAIRLARAFTGRKKIVKFEGCYHGHADSFLVKAGSGVATLGIPGSPGVLEEVVANTIAVPYNDLDALRQVFDKDAREIAAVIVEPVPANMGVIPPKEGYLKTLRKWTSELDILLIFDEVITGFRLGLGGAQEYFGVMPDLTCLGKIIGGGLPVGAYGGRRNIMEMVAPEGPVYQAGTLSGNPIATAAGLATLDILTRPGTYDALEEKARTLEEGLEGVTRDLGVPCVTQRIGSMMTAFFGATGPVTNFEDALLSNTKMYGAFFREMLEQNIWLAPSQFEAAFVSLAHDWKNIENTIASGYEAMRELV